MLRVNGRGEGSIFSEAIIQKDTSLGESETIPLIKRFDSAFQDSSHSVFNTQLIVLVTAALRQRVRSRYELAKRVQVSPYRWHLGCFRRQHPNDIFKTYDRL